MVIRLEDEILNLGQLTTIQFGETAIYCDFSGDGTRTFDGTKAEKLKWFLTNFEHALGIHNVDTLWAQKDITAAGLVQEPTPLEQLTLSPAQVEEALRQVEIQLRKTRGTAPTKAELDKVREMIQNGGRA